MLIVENSCVPVKISFWVPETRVNDVLKCIQGGAEQLAHLENSTKKKMDIYLILWSIINQNVYSILL